MAGPAVPSLGGGAPLGQGPDLMPPDPQTDPQQLLDQIRALLDQYLALGDHTPVAEEAQMLADAIDQEQGQGGPQMGDLTQGPPPSSTTEPPPSKSKTFGGANKTANDRLKKRQKSQGF